MGEHLYKRHTKLSYGRGHVMGALSDIFLLLYSINLIKQKNTFSAGSQISSNEDRDPQKDLHVSVFSFTLLIVDDICIPT